MVSPEVIVAIEFHEGTGGIRPTCELRTGPRSMTPSLLVPVLVLPPLPDLPPPPFWPTAVPLPTSPGIAFGVWAHPAPSRPTALTTSTASSVEGGEDPPARFRAVAMEVPLVTVRPGGSELAHSGTNPRWIERWSNPHAIGPPHGPQPAGQRPAPLGRTQRVRAPGWQDRVD